MADTPHATPADALQTRIQRNLPGPERLKIAVEMSLLARDLSLTRLRDEHPESSEAELLLALVRLAFPPGALPKALR